MTSPAYKSYYVTVRLDLALMRDVDALKASLAARVPRVLRRPTGVLEGIMVLFADRVQERLGGVNSRECSVRWKAGAGGDGPRPVVLIDRPLPVLASVPLVVGA